MELESPLPDLNCRPGTFQFNLAEADRIHAALKEWITMKRISKIDWCIERGVQSEEDLLRCLKLKKESLWIEGLDNMTLCKKYWEICNPLNEFSYLTSRDPLYLEMRGGSRAGGTR